MGVVQANVEYALLRLGERGDSEVGEALQDAEDAAKRLRAMIEDLLLVASSEEAQLPVRRQRVAVRPLLEEVRRRHARAATERNVSLDIVATGGEEVAADRVLLSRALDNLVDNALRYTPRAGRVEMAAHVAGEAIFTVSNTGRAIPASERASLFEKYARVVDTQSGRSARVGPGLGLHFCRRAAEAHGGQIDVVETEDWPNRFVLRVPPATDAAASVQEHG
jgi:signal transduction histidine kinase